MLRVGIVEAGDLRGRMGVAGEDPGAGTGGDPEQEVDAVLVPPAVGQPGGELGLADAAEPGQDLSEHHRPSCVHRGGEGVLGGPVLPVGQGRWDHADAAGPGDRRTLPPPECRWRVPWSPKIRPLPCRASIGIGARIG
ncbi:hypothetical protein Val02_10370 [Virgisporangium aliadipatigenens]|uniref:Uncharacterized protein n=1 Tax=Virgisporangium aliadipatigenens TaxID=741659 RepID=A0A8J3YHR0_9ACTN|nr:hypothetical protein Val02_10370 [Virgisporangium aliadipatigenens]